MAEWGRSGTGDRRVGDSHAATFQRAGGRGLRRIVRRRPPTLTIPDSEVVVPRFGGVALLGSACWPMTGAHGKTRLSAGVPPQGPGPGLVLQRHFVITAVVRCVV